MSKPEPTRASLNSIFTASTAVNRPLTAGDSLSVTTQTNIRNLAAEVFVKSIEVLAPRLDTTGQATYPNSKYKDTPAADGTAKYVANGSTVSVYSGDTVTLAGAFTANALAHKTLELLDAVRPAVVRYLDNRLDEESVTAVVAACWQLAEVVEYLKSEHTNSDKFNNYGYRASFVRNVISIELKRRIESIIIAIART